MRKETTQWQNIYNITYFNNLKQLVLKIIMYYYSGIARISQEGTSSRFGKLRKVVNVCQKIRQKINVTLKKNWTGTHCILQ